PIGLSARRSSIPVKFCARLPASVLGKLHCGEGLPDQGPVRAVHDNCEIENQSNCCAMQISTRRAYFVEKLRNQALGSNLTELYSGFLKFYRFSSVYSGHWRTVFCLLKICKRSIEFFNRIGRSPLHQYKNACRKHNLFPLFSPP
ncbi:MAG: hypothetical protein ACI9ND_002574, partial [Yoonia sp.]